MLLYAPSLLHAKIAAVCPIDGVSIGDPAITSTWIFWPQATATPAQIAAATALLAKITPAQLAAADATVAAAVPADPLAAAKATAVGTLAASVGV